MLEDIQIIEGCIDKDPQCRKLLYEKYAPSLYAVALRYTKSEQDAQDVLQESFLRIFDNIKQYKGKGGFPQWLARVVVHHALNYNRHHQTYVNKVHFDDYEERIADAPIADASVLTHKVLLGFIQELSPGYRSVFNLCAIEGYSSEEAAKQLHCSSSTCRTQLLKAKKLLQKKVNEFLIKENK